MKKISSIVLAIALVFGVSFLAFFNSKVDASQPADNYAGAIKYDWNLSGDVMPVPPYGSMDIEGSDTRSKLIVNRPNGEVRTKIVGVMKGLNPNTEYTVYLANSYTPFVNVDVTGDWTWTVLGTYIHDISIDTQNPDGTFSGTGGYPSGESPYNDPGQTTEVITGEVHGNQIMFTTTYGGPYNPGYDVTVEGTINPDGSITGTSPWSWEAPAESVTPQSGSMGFPGLLTGVSPFTFMTNERGTAAWNYAFTELIPNFSVWINGGGKTILISDPISL